jgi:DNA (cytosine-5)-methyltransferase 1
VGHAPVYGSGAFVGQSRAGARRQEQAGGSGVHGLLADADPRGPGEHRSGGLFDGERPALGDDADGRSQGLMADANGAGLQERERDGRVQRQTLGPSARQAAVGRGDPGFWSDLEWLPCSDGKARPTIPGLFPLAHGVQRRASKLRAYGNAIVPQVAAEFIKSCSHMTDELPG